MATTPCLAAAYTEPDTLLWKRPAHDEVWISNPSCCLRIAGSTASDA